MQRLAPFEHDVVCHIDDVVDRPHPGVGQAALHPARRGADLHVRQQHRGVARTQFRVFNFDFHLAGDRLALRLALVLRQLQLGTSQRGHLAGDPNQRLRPRQVRRHLQLQHDIAHEIGRRYAHRRVGFEEDDPLVLLVDAQLIGGADHRLAWHAADLSRLEFLECLRRRMAVEQNRPA